MRDIRLISEILATICTHIPDYGFEKKMRMKTKKQFENANIIIISVHQATSIMNSDKKYGKWQLLIKSFQLKLENEARYIDRKKNKKKWAL